MQRKGMDTACSMYGNEKKVRTGSSFGKPVKKIDHLEILGADGKIILKCFFKKWDGECTGFMWHRSGTRVRLS